MPRCRDMNYMVLFGCNGMGRKPIQSGETDKKIELGSSEKEEY
jgi:hypothetical protein